jgi:hypothetical protein
VTALEPNLQAAGRVRECPPRLPFVFAVGVTGHRKDSLPESSLPAIEERLRTALSVLYARASALFAREAQSFSGEPPRLLLISPLADGADQMAAEIALELGYELHAILPFRRDTYRADLADDEVRGRFDALLARAACVLELPGESSHHFETYLMAGRATVAHSDLLVAVWDGLPPRGRGGTGEVVQLAFARGTPTIHVPVEEAEPVRLRWSAYEPAILSQSGDLATIQPFDTDTIDATLNALLAPPPSPDERRFIDEFHKECRRRMHIRIEYPLLLAAAGVSPLKRAQWRADVAAKHVQAEWSRYQDACSRAQALTAPLDRLQIWYEWADALAGHFAQSYRSGHVFNFLLGALAVLLALTTLVWPDGKKLLAFGEFAAVLAILANTWLGTRQQWHRRWLDYRQLAERLRPMRSLNLLGLAAPDPPGTEVYPVPRRWVEWHAAAVWRAIGCPAGAIDQSAVRLLASAIAEHELQPQIDYNSSAANQAEKFDRRLEALGYGVFALALLGCVVLIAGFWLAPQWVKYNSNWFTMLSAGLPAIGTAAFGIRVQGDYLGVGARSEQTAHSLEAISTRLVTEEVTLTRAADLVEQAARTMLTDLDEWRLLNQQHELSVG